MTDLIKVYDVDIFQIVDYLKDNGFDFIREPDDMRIDRYSINFDENDCVICGWNGKPDTFTIGNTNVSCEKFLEFFNLVEPKDWYVLKSHDEIKNLMK